MAETNSTPQVNQSMTDDALANNLPNWFKGIDLGTYGENIYTVSPETTRSDIRNHLSARISQLVAMLKLTYGGDFQGWRHDVHDNYMWACASIASECESLLPLI